MVLYDENTDINLDKFDIYNQYRDQICYMKVDKHLFDIVIDPDNWQELGDIIKLEDKTKKIQSVRQWLEKTAPNKFGKDKEFDFTDSLIEIIMEDLKNKF